MTDENQTAEMSSLKKRLKDIWSAGDFGQIAKSYEVGAEEFILGLGLKPGQKVLDVACGTGNLAFAAAKAGATVTGVDIAPNLVAQAKERAANEKQNIAFDEGDVESMPYEVSTFDAAVTMFGAMFAPRPELVVSELLRVTRDGGMIAMANWTPTSFIGEIFKTIGSFVPPPSIMPSPLQWGDEKIVCERFGNEVREISTRRRLIAFEFDLEPGQVVSFWRQYYGPTQRAFDALREKPEMQTKLHHELEMLWNSSNKANGGRTVVESEYLEVVVSR